MKYNLYCQQRMKLLTGLYLGNESFCGPLLEIKKTMIELHAVPLMDLKQMKTFQSSEFVEYQQTKRQEASRKFEEHLDKIKANVEDVCTAVIKMARSSDAYEQMQAGRGLTGGADKSKSMVALKEEIRNQHKALKRAEQETTMLPNFIRLVDYIAVESLAHSTVNTFQGLLNDLTVSRRTDASRRGGIFETSVVFAPEGTIFQPPVNDLQQMISQLMTDTINAVSSVPRLIDVSPLNRFVEGIIVDCIHVSDTILKSKKYKELVVEVNQAIADDFVDAAEQVKVFDSLRPIYRHDLEWDFQKYSKEDHTVEGLDADLKKLSSWYTDLEKMRQQTLSGMLHVESKKLKEKLRPMTFNKMEQLKKFIKDLARSRCKGQLAKYKEHEHHFKVKPNGLKDFSSYIELTGSLEGEKDSMKLDTSIIESMYALLDSYKVKIVSEDMVRLEDLKQQNRATRRKLKRANLLLPNKSPTWKNSWKRTSIEWTSSWNNSWRIWIKVISSTQFCMTRPKSSCKKLTKPEHAWTTSKPSRRITQKAKRCAGWRLISLSC